MSEKDGFKVVASGMIWPLGRRCLADPVEIWDFEALKGSEGPSGRGDFPSGYFTRIDVI